jgi:hypothetical protein
VRRAWGAAELNGVASFAREAYRETDLGSEQFPLLFLTPRPGADALTVARALLDGTPSPDVVPLDVPAILQAVRRRRGLARMKVALPHFSFDNPRAEGAFLGTALPTHIFVQFFGNFEKVAEPLFHALAATGLECYSVWEKSMLTEWPKWEGPTIDSGFGERITRILERKTAELRATEPDENRRRQMLDAFTKGPEFRAEMAREARREPGRARKVYDDVVNCYVRWKDGRASAAELGAVRKLDPKFSLMSLSELKKQAGDGPRLLVATAIVPQRAAGLRRSAEELGLCVENESVAARPAI